MKSNPLVHRNRLAATLAATALAALTACGGGSDDDKPAALSVDVLVDGTSTGSPLAAGASGTVEVASGAQLEFDSTGDSKWEVKSAQATYDVVNFSLTEKDMTVDSVKGGTVTIVFTNSADESQTATLTVTVKPHEYAMVVRKVGTLQQWNESNVQVNAARNSTPFTQKVTSVSDDGYVLHEVFDGTFASDRTYDAAGNVMTRHSLDSDITCTWNPRRELLQFPLHYGKSWASNWVFDCSSGFHQEATSESKVDGYAKVTVAAGTFDALRVTTTIHWTNSNDPNLAGGSEGKGEYTQVYACWWAPTLGQNIKCSIANTYVGEVPYYYSKSVVDELVSTGE